MDLFEERCFSQESGIGTIIEAGLSLGSLENLSHEVETEVDFHVVLTEALQEKIEWLYEQLNKKDNQMAAQQETIVSLQNNLSSLQMEFNICRFDIHTQQRAMEYNDRLKDETITLLQDELSECQLQYTECFEQLVNLEIKLIAITEDNSFLRARVEALSTPKPTQDYACQTDKEPEEPWSLAWEVVRLNEELNSKMSDWMESPKGNISSQQLLPKRNKICEETFTVNPKTPALPSSAKAQRKLLLPPPPYQCSRAISTHPRPRSCCFATLV